MNNLFQKLGKDTLLKLISESYSISDIFKKLNICVSGTYYKIFKNTLKSFNIDSLNFLDKKLIKKQRRTVSELLVSNSLFNYGSSNLKKRLLKEGYLKNICSICQIGPVWNNNVLSLQLDHINGIRSDNRLENLRILCPNCHSQTSNYAGKNNKSLDGSIDKKKYTCLKCGVKKSCKSPVCIKCSKIDLKIKWPQIVDIKSKLDKFPASTYCKELDVSLTALRKFCKKNGIELKSHGYWQRRKAGLTHDEAINKKPHIPKYKKISEEEMETILKLHKNGESNRQIALLLKRAHTTIEDALKRVNPPSIPRL